MGCGSSKDGIKPEEREIHFHHNYRLRDKIRCHKYTQVRIAERKENVHDLRMVKIVDCEDPSEPNQMYILTRKAASHEVEIMRHLHGSDHLVKLHQAFYGERFCYLVFDGGTNFVQFLEAHHYLHENALGRMFTQLLAGVTHMHVSKVVHRNIKPDSVWVLPPTRVRKNFLLRLGDFSRAEKLSNGKPLDKTLIGTLPFMAPEMLRGEQCDAKIDVWAVGVMAYVLLLGAFPYMPKGKDQHVMKHGIMYGDPAPSFRPASAVRTQYEQEDAEGPSPEAEAFLRRLLVRDPSERMPAMYANELDYMKKVRDLDPAKDPKNLPQLRPVVHQAKKIGAFESRLKVVPQTADEVLAVLQKRHMKWTLPPVRVSEHEHSPTNSSRFSSSASPRDTSRSSEDAKRGSPKVSFGAERPHRLKASASYETIATIGSKNSKLTGFQAERSFETCSTTATPATPMSNQLP